MFNLELRSVTIFAPTNEAFQKFAGGRQHVHVQYHMCKYQPKNHIIVVVSRRYLNAYNVSTN